MLNSKLYCALGYACNNNCLICVVDSEKKAKANLQTVEIINYLKILDTNPEIKNIEFSGGEPTVRHDLFYILDWVHQHHPRITYTIFSNGRRFCDIDFANKISGYPVKDLLIAIHGKDAKTHDLLTQRKGSFNQTFMGIRNLSENKVNVVLKIIPNQLNYRQIPDIVRMFVSHFPYVRTMTINGIDIGGCALDNIDKIGLRLTDAIPYIQKGLDIANEHGLKVCTYSIPECLFDAEHRKYVGPQKSPLYNYKSPFHELDDKGDEYGFGPLCSACSAKDNCAGCWNTYLSAVGTDELKPIVRPKSNPLSSPKPMQKNRYVIEITGACNNDCIFCLYNGSRSESISYEDIVSRIQSFNMKKGEQVSLCGGEPTLSMDFVKIIDYAVSKGFRISVISNGRKFSDKLFTEQVINAGVSHITIDIHAHTKELHDSITQKDGSFDETVRGIRNLQSTGVALTLKVIVNKLNYRYLKNIIEFIAVNFTGIKSVVFASISIRGSALKNKEQAIVKLNEAAPYIQKAIDKAQASGIRVDLDMFPYCIFEHKYFKQIRMRKQDNLFLLDDSCVVKPDNASSVKGSFPFCRECRFANKCPGVWKNYRDIYGESEFKCIHK